MSLFVFNLLINIKLPGILPKGTPGSETFWISFWSALYSGILSSIFTGLIVGVVVWQLQVQAENRANLREIQKDLEALRENLELISSKSSINNITSPHQAIATKVSETFILLKSQPLKRWQNLLSNQSYFFIEEMLLFIQIYNEFIVAADNFDLQLNQTIRKYNYKNNVAACYDRYFCEYIIARVIGAAHNDILPHIHNAPDEIIKKLNINFANAILLEPNLIQPIQLYQEARKNLWQAFQRVDRELSIDDLLNRHIRNRHMRRTGVRSLLRSAKLRLMELCKKLTYK